MFKDRGAQATLLGQKFVRKLFLGSANYTILFGFMKCRIIFLGLQCGKSVRIREKFGLHTKLVNFLGVQGKRNHVFGQFLG